jgi:outer membrane protein OmpA-like peptidoglycan-associated protein
MKLVLQLAFCCLLSCTGWYRLAAQPASAPVGDGLLGDYYQGRNFEQFRHRQVDAAVSFNLNGEPPAEGLPSEDFSIRWTGWLRAPASGHYILYLTVDDGARLWLDGRQLLDEWRGQSATSYKLDLNLQAGRACRLRLDYCQYGALASIWLAWVRPEQFAQASRDASWRNLWGLTANSPVPALIPTRYLFSRDPTLRALPVPPATPQPQARPVSPALVSKPQPKTKYVVPLVVKPRQPAIQRPASVAASPIPVPQSLSVGEQLAGGQALILPALHFAQSQADILPAAKISLDSLATALAQHPSLRLQVQGHTDNQGDSTLNRQLSQRRAEAVCRYLVEHGVAADRLQATGYGGSHPIVDNQNPALRARNRRVVLQPLP